MTLQQLRIVAAVARNGTFSGAALELGIGQSTVSAAVAELEDELNVRLMDRGRTGAKPTAVGERIIAHALQALEASEAIRQEASAETGSLRGHLRIAAIRSAAARIAPAIVAALRAAHPGLTVSLHDMHGTPEALAEALDRGHVDVAIVQADMAGEALFWAILQDTYQAVLPPGWRATEHISLAALTSQPFVLTCSDDACARPVVQAMRALEPSFRPAFEVGEDSTVLSLVGQALGVTVMPSMSIDAVPQGARVVDLEEPMARTLGVALSASSLKMPAVRAFLGAVRDAHPQGEVPPLAQTSVKGPAEPRPGAASPLT
jgi:DNA-binding transcriptional LysR family regulator